MSESNGSQQSEGVRSFLWLDDDPDRVTPDLKYQIENPEGLPPVKLSVIDLKAADIPTKITEVLGMQTKPDLVIIDHFLNGAHGTIMKMGSSIAAIIREAWPEIPIVGVSAKFNTKQDKFSRVFEQEYIELFDVSSPTADIPSLHAICAGFHTLYQSFEELKPAGQSPKEKIADLLDCPASDREDLIAILPSEFKAKADSANVHPLARWIWHQFTERPGLLYDSQYAAVMLGLNKEGFAKIAPLFESARYKGGFASASRPRWWTSSLKRQLLELVPTPKFATTLERGRCLSGVTLADHSKATFSEAENPDTLASRDTADLELHPERIENTDIHPDETLVTGFEPRRIFKPS